MRELAVAGAEIRRAASPSDALGIDLAREIAAELRRLGARAQAHEAGAAPEEREPDRVVISGRLAALDGGSRVARTLLPVAGRWGAARCRLELRIRAPDDGATARDRTLVQSSLAPRRAWAEPGDPVADRCLKVAAIEAARRIWWEGDRAR